MSPHRPGLGVGRRRLHPDPPRTGAFRLLLFAMRPPTTSSDDVFGPLRHHGLTLTQVNSVVPHRTQWTVAARTACSRSPSGHPPVCMRIDDQKSSDSRRTLRLINLMRKVRALADYLGMRQAGDPDQVPGEIEKNVGGQAECEITELVGRSRAAGHVWHFMNAVTANLIQIHLCQQESMMGEGGVITRAGRCLSQVGEACCASPRATQKC
jgi:hypothetical protein